MQIKYSENCCQSPADRVGWGGNLPRYALDGLERGDYLEWVKGWMPSDATLPCRRAGRLPRRSAAKIVRCLSRMTDQHSLAGANDQRSSHKNHYGPGPVQRTHAIPPPIRDDRRRPLPQEDCMGYATILGLDLGKFKSVCCVMDPLSDPHAFETLASTPGMFADLLTRHAAVHTPATHRITGRQSDQPNRTPPPASRRRRGRACAQKPLGRKRDSWLRGYFEPPGRRMRSSFFWTRSKYSLPCGNSARSPSPCSAHTHSSASSAIKFK